jgi:hypothetical protein
VNFHFCDLYSSIFATLDAITAKLRIKSGCAEDDDCSTLERSLGNPKQLWNAANLSHTPKVHSLLTHAPKQMRKFKGIGDLLEDDVEKMHQIAGNFESQSSRLKSATGRAVAQAKMEEHMQLLQQISKRKSDVDDIKKQKGKVLKTEHDQKQPESLDKIEQNPIPKLITAYEKLKDESKKPNN